MPGKEMTGMHFHWRLLRRLVLTAAVTATLLLVAAGAAGAAGPFSTGAPAATATARTSMPDSIVGASLETIRLWNRAGLAADAERAARARLAEAERVHGKESAEVAEVLDELGIALRRGGKAGQPEALEVCERSLRIREHAFGKEDPRYATSLYHLGLVLYMGYKNYDRVRSTLEEALEIRRQKLGSNHPDVAKTLLALAAVHHDLGDYFEALALTERAVAIEEIALSASDPERAQGLGSLAMNRYSTGDFSGAIPLYEEAIRLWERSPTPNQGAIANYLHNLGVVYDEMGDHEHAINILERALRLREEKFGGNNRWVAATLNVLGYAYQGRGDLPRSKASLQRAVRILNTSSPEDFDLGFYRSSLGWVYLDDGDVARAADAFHVALREQEAVQDPRLWMTLRGLAMVARHRGEMDTARGYYERTLDLVRRSGSNHPDLGQTLAEYASFRLATGDTLGAIDMALQAAEVNREHLRLTARGVAEHQALLYTSSRETGLNVAFAALSRLSTTRADKYVRRGWDALIRSRAMVLDEVGQRARLVEGAGDLIEVAKRLEAARSRLSNLLLREATGDPEREMLARSREEVNRIERELAASSATFRSSRDRAALGWDQIVSALPPQAALVSYANYSLDGRRSLLAFVVGKDRVARVAALGSAEEVDRLIARWRTLTASAPMGGSRDQAIAETACRQAGQALRARIWDPLESFLIGSSLVLVVPDGVLHLLSLVALPTRNQGGYLIDSPYAIHYLSAERDIVVGTAVLSRGVGMLALGGASFDGRARNPKSSSTVAYRGLPESRSREIRESLLECEGYRKMRFQPLPGTAAEVDSVTKLWGSRDEVTVLEGEDAGERAVKQLLPGKKVAHFATHGFFLDRPCGWPRSNSSNSRAIGGIDADAISPQVPRLDANPFLLAGLALAGANRKTSVGPDEEDGILTAEEIASLDLDGLDWVVLSACDTGLGDVRSGDGVLGLRRAFEIAGAGTLIMSLWSVEDLAARDWMSRLYAARFRQNLETAEAVREADRGALNALRARGASTHPFFWAGFVAAGGWR